MREDTKTVAKAVRTLTCDEILAVSGGARLKLPHPGGNRQGLGGGLLGEIVNEVVHAGRRAARELPFPIF